MATRIVADSDAFADGQVLTPRGDHTDTMNPKLRPAEELIRSGKADGDIIRSNCIYVWESRESGESNWRYEKDKHLYELEIDEADILHTGNAYLLATLSQIAEPPAAAEVVQSYWNGDPRSKRVELLVTKAKVLRKLRLNALQCVFINEKRSLHRAIVPPKPNRAPGRIIEAALIWKTKHGRSRSRSKPPSRPHRHTQPSWGILPVEGLVALG